jgi:hypothetical protein
MSITIILEATRFHCPNCDQLLDFDDPDQQLIPYWECPVCRETYTDDSPCWRHDSKDVTGTEIPTNEGAFMMCPACEMVVTEDPSSCMVPVITCVCHDDEHEVYN